MPAQSRERSPSRSMAAMRHPPQTLTAGARRHCWLRPSSSSLAQLIAPPLLSSKPNRNAAGAYPNVTTNSLRPRQKISVSVAAMPAQSRERSLHRSTAARRHPQRTPAAARLEERWMRARSEMPTICSFIFLTSYIIASSYVRRHNAPVAQLPHTWDKIWFFLEINILSNMIWGILSPN